MLSNTFVTREQLLSNEKSISPCYKLSNKIALELIDKGRWRCSFIGVNAIWYYDQRDIPDYIAPTKIIAHKAIDDINYLCANLGYFLEANILSAEAYTNLKEAHDNLHIEILAQDEQK